MLGDGTSENAVQTAAVFFQVAPEATLYSFSTNTSLSNGVKHLDFFTDCVPVIDEKRISNVFFSRVENDKTAREKHAAVLAARPCLKEFWAACNAAITAGMDVTTTQGTEHFSLQETDQINLTAAVTAVQQGAAGYPYHADGEPCQSYTAAEIMAIYGTLSMYKTGQLTYHNQLKQSINAMEAVQEVQAVTYGQELTGEYLTAYNTLMQEAQAQMQAVISKVGGADAAG